MAESFLPPASLLDKKRPAERFAVVILVAENKQRNPGWEHWRAGWQFLLRGQLSWVEAIHDLTGLDYAYQKLGKREMGVFTSLRISLPVNSSGLLMV